MSFKQSFSHTKSDVRHLNQKGFSLIELMVVVSIIAIITVIAAPSVEKALERQRNKDTASAVISALKTAKVESNIRKQDIKVSLSDNLISVVSVAASPVTIADYNIHTKAPVKVNGSTTFDVTFKRNKTIDMNNSKGVDFVVMCNTNNKTGRTVNLDISGNIQLKTEGSLC